MRRKSKDKRKDVSWNYNYKGFTLSELLIVVAIIAVLIAISIPVLSNQLEKAREATDTANIRAALELVSERSFDTDVPHSVEEGEEYSKVYEQDGKYIIWVKITQDKEEWQSYDTSSLNITGENVTVSTSGDHWVVSFDSKNQKFSIVEE